MKDKIKTMLIGLFVAIACGLLIGMVLFFEPSVGDGKQTLLFRFSNVNGLNVGTRVSLAGKPIGEVVAIQQIPDARQQTTDTLGGVYFYQLVAHLDSSAVIYTTDEITIQTSGLLGEKSINIIPKEIPKGFIAKRATGKEPLYADSADPFEFALNELSTLADKMDDAFGKISNWIDDNGQALGSAVRSFDDAMSEAAIAIGKANSTGLIEDMDTATVNFSSAMSDLSTAMNTLEEENTFANTGIMIRNFKDASYSIEDVANNLADGKGTLGKIMQDDDLYLRVTSLMSKVDTLLNDMNQYGVLFNLNKQWQRTRVKRASMLSALNTPEQFKDYFEKEIDLINSSMARLSMLIERAQQTEERARVLQTPLFKEDFAELMRGVEAMEANLKLYNEQLMDAKQNQVVNCEPCPQ
ncbi:MAG: MlaD family protein [Candidatus Algichlamydia australiensis]|nr:MlaD family protein [Chlamydiales bacterium]